MIDKMTSLAKKYALVDESTYNRLMQRSSKPRNPFTNVDISTTKDIGSSMRNMMTSDVDASTKQLMFSSLLNSYRDSFKKATGKRKRTPHQNGKHNHKQTDGKPQPSQAIEGQELLTDNPRNVQLLPETPPTTPTLKKKRPVRKRVNKTFDEHRVADIFGGFVSSPTAKRFARVLNDMNTVGLVRHNGTFKTLDVDGQGQMDAQKVKRTIRDIVISGGAQKPLEQAVATELQRRGVTLV